jgi:hypothetical protein
MTEPKVIYSPEILVDSLYDLHPAGDDLYSRSPENMADINLSIAIAWETFLRDYDYENLRFNVRH